MSAVPRWVQVTGAASVALVAAVAAVVSYSHMHELAEWAGEGWRAWLEPLSVDGLLVGSSLVLYARRRSSWLTWIGLSVGLLVSLAANLAAARPELVSRLVAAWPAVALALSYEVLLTLVRKELDRSTEGLTTVVTPARQPWAGTAGTAVPADPPEEPDRSGPFTDRYGVEPTGGPTGGPTGPAERTDDELLTQLRVLAERHGGTPSLTAVRTGLRVGTGRARRLLGRLGGDLAASQTSGP